MIASLWKVHLKLPCSFIKCLPPLKRKHWIYKTDYKSLVRYDEIESLLLTTNFQEYLLLILSTIKEWRADPIMESFSGFKHEITQLEIRNPDHKVNLQWLWIATSWCLKGRKQCSFKILSATFLLVCFVCLKESIFETRKNVFLFHFEKSSFRSWDNQILTFQIFQCHDVIRCLSIKHETHFAE